MTADPAVIIAELDDADRPAWQAYVEAAREATVFHDLRWLGAVEAAYRYRAINLIAKKGDGVIGVLPLTLVAAPLLGRSLVSAAFAVGGGIVADDAEVARSLGRHALELGRRLNVNYVELRGGPAPGEGFQEKTGVYASFVKEMPTDADAIRQWLPRNRRAEVKKSLRIDRSPENAFRLAEGVDEFYELYAAALRNLGTPVMPRKFLRSLKAHFGDDVDIALVERHGRPIAGLFSFWWRNRAVPYYIGAGDIGRRIRVYDYLYYSLMRRAVLRGVRIFDFGRSKVGSTHFDTKTYWGFEPAPVVYHVALVRAKALPNVNPANPKFARFVSLWRRLPLPLANALGPVIARNFP